MAPATAMDFPHDRRLTISKPSSARITKRTAPSAAPSRPIAHIVKASPSTFRRVVQELTGSTTPSPPPPPPPSAPPGSSRLRRMAPPPLPPHFRASFQHARAPDRQLLLLHANQQQRHQQQQQQHQQQLLAMTMPHPSPINPLHAPLLLASTPLASSPLLPPGQFPRPLIPPLPMLSPRLFSPLPSLTPGDNAWACPLDVLPPVPAPILYPLPLPPPGRNGDGAFNGVSERLERGPPPPPISPLQMPISPAARFPWPSPWSSYFPVSPVPPIYPGYFPPSPGFGISNLYSGSTASNGAMDFSSPRDFTFQSPSDYGFFKPS